jgi:hypothetical protein
VSEVFIAKGHRKLRIHGKVVQVDQIPESEAKIVVDKIAARLQSLQFFQGWTFSRSSQFQAQPQDIPHIGVYFIEERLTPDGDADVGEPRFRSTAQIGFSVYIADNDPDATLKTLDDVYQVITRGILMSPKIYLDASGNKCLQGYASGRRVHVFGAMTKDNNLPIAELQYTLSIDLGTITYEPVIPDMLEVVHVETHPSPDSDLILSEYDFDTQ